MIYLIGDLQGCCDAFERLLRLIDFSPSRDRLYVLGDLVNRGPCSLKVLERLAGFGEAATCLLGNHDLHLLGVAHGVRKLHRSDTVSEILDSPQREHWLDWLRQQRMAVSAHGWLMVHAGVAPQWTAEQTLSLAGEIEALLRGPNLGAFVQEMYGNKPARWKDSRTGAERWRVIVNVLTRMRLCDADGRLDFEVKEGPGAAPPHLMPWFEVPGRRTAGVPIAFGHWSTLGELNHPELLPLDTGCVWGGRLTAARLDPVNPLQRELISVNCPQAQAPH